MKNGRLSGNATPIGSSSLSRQGGSITIPALDMGPSKRSGAQTLEHAMRGNEQSIKKLRLSQGIQNQLNMGGGGGSVNQGNSNTESRVRIQSRFAKPE